jgi:hypothetical protein
MQDFNRFLEFRRDVVEAELNVINRYLKGRTAKKQKGTSKIDTVKNVLKDAGRPLHITEIIETARKDYRTDLERDSVVSILVKKIKAGQTFKRTAPNTFALME